MSRWFEEWKAHRGGGQREATVETVETAEESLLSSAIRLSCKRTAYTARGLLPSCPRVLLIFVASDEGCYEFENINLIKDWREAGGIVNLLRCWSGCMQHRSRNEARWKLQNIDVVLFHWILSVLCMTYNMCTNKMMMYCLLNIMDCNLNYLKHCNFYIVNFSIVRHNHNHLDNHIVL